MTDAGVVFIPTVISTVVNVGSMLDCMLQATLECMLDAFTNKGQILDTGSLHRWTLPPAVRACLASVNEREKMPILIPYTLIQLGARLPVPFKNTL